jgi:hypothetical protein
MATSWLSAVLPYLGGGFFGAASTYAVTLPRERRRSLDTYRAPQRQAIGEIVTATHELMLRELEARTVLTDQIEQIRRGEWPTEVTTVIDVIASPAAKFGRASLDAERAMQIGRLTIVDPPAFEALGVAYFALNTLRRAMAARADAPPMQTPEEFEQYRDGIKVLAEQFNQSVEKLVIAATDQLSPAETLVNRRRRRAARHRLGQRYQQAQSPDQLQQQP